jgi:hypothetical protein
MATVGNESRPAYVYDLETDTWVPIGIGPHTHDEYIDKTIITAKGDIVVGVDLDTPGILYVGEDNQVLTANSSATNGVEWATQEGYRLVETIYYTSSGTFTKATYPWLRAIKAKVVGGGGGGRGISGTINIGEAGGGGGGYSEVFITDIAGLATSNTITVGAGGTAASNADGGAGGDTTAFGRFGGGGAGATTSGRGLGGNGFDGDFNTPGGDGGGGLAGLTAFAQQPAGHGGSSMLAHQATTTIFLSPGTSVAGQAGKVYGGGGAGAACRGTASPARAGGVGAPGIVILELYA